MNNPRIPEKDELERLYALGHSMSEIAELLDMAVGKIHRYFTIYQIKPRKHLNERAKQKNK